MAVLLAVAGISLIIGAAIWVVRPDLLALLVWPLLLLYPRHLLHGLLPANAGLNQLLIVLIAARFLFYSHPDRSPTFRWGIPVVWIAVGMVFMQAAAEFTGAVYMGREVLWLLFYRSTALGFLFIACSLIFTKAIVTDRELTRHLYVFLVTIALAFLLVWACSNFEAARAIWEDYGSKEIRESVAQIEGTVEMRSWGPFDFTSGVGVMFVAVFPLAVGLALAQGSARMRVIAALTVAAALVAQIVTKSRSPFIGVAFVVIGWVAFSRWRWRVFFILIAAGILGLVFAIATGQGSALMERLTGYRIRTDYGIRSDTWYTVITHPNPFILAFGEGGPSMMERIRLAPHNGFLDALFLWGLFGVAMFVILYRATLKWALKALRSDFNPLGTAIGWGTCWSVVAVAGAALTLDPWYVTNYRVFCYFLLALLWQRKQAIEAAQGELQVVDAQEQVPDAYPVYFR